MEFNDVFSFMKELVREPIPGKKLELYENWICPVSEKDLLTAEQGLGYEFPAQLRSLYRQGGFGAILTGTSGRQSISHNQIIHPLDIPKLLDSTCEWMMPYTEIQPGTLPFFDRDIDLFLCLRPGSDNPNAVHWMWGDKICDSLVEFFQRLVVDPDWFNPPKDRASTH